MLFSACNEVKLPAVYVYPVRPSKYIYLADQKMPILYLLSV